ncbi:GNAT family N-acetyltransferase [Crossiella sp. SN42]|uniref:GNAT family N-acetyltransferase n=1 Tax=Crossiella sp. SN42 TaxID=2944808 RepID=UPI00207CADDA|nr:GNAT family N-acetyltransferase [Crossiella sp. SN42]MCO1575317.1 GNAT family N-acetyltransferase [Crossiella sp. SN42]
MDGFQVARPGSADVAEILALVHASDIAAVGFADFDESEVVSALAESWVVRDRDGLAVGWGYLDPPGAAEEVCCEAYARPGADPAVQAELVRLLLGRLAERAPVTARSAATPGETAYIRVLEQAGFAFERQHARMTRPLTGDEQRPAPVPGYTLRRLNSGELVECHELLRTAFTGAAQPFPGTLGELADTPGIRWAESLVAEADSGELAGVVVSSGQSPASEEGWVKWLGVLPAHRGRGLGRALLAGAFAAYAEEGLGKAGLGVDTTNPTGAYRLYESVGMTPAYLTNIYRQVITG